MSEFNNQDPQHAFSESTSSYAFENTQNMGWVQAAIKILEEKREPMHYADLAEEIVKKKLRKAGATPANSLNTALNLSIRNKGEDSPFVKIDIEQQRGIYFLKDLSEDALARLSSETEDELENNQPRAEDESALQIIKAFGIFWEREQVSWTSSPKLLGKQQPNADNVDFCNQTGIYILYDGKELVYIGRSIDRPMGIRLFEHTKDRLRGRWNRFSWFGLKEVKDSGEIGPFNSEDKPINESDLVSLLESVLIEIAEPPLNRKRGDNFHVLEYLQTTDPAIKKGQMLELLSKLRESIE